MANKPELWENVGKNQYTLKRIVFSATASQQEHFSEVVSEEKKYSRINIQPFNIGILNCFCSPLQNLCIVGEFVLQNIRRGELERRNELPFDDGNNNHIHILYTIPMILPRRLQLLLRVLFFWKICHTWMWAIKLLFDSRTLEHH